MSKKHLYRLSLTGAAAAIAIMAGGQPAFAQHQQTTDEAANAASDNQIAGLNDIVVTARKVSENLQTVPVAITAFSGDALKSASISNVFDIQGKVPNLYLQNSAIDAAGLTVAMRGQKQNDFILTVDPSVGVYVDGFYHPRTYGMRSAIIDVERMEVLRGPQGTLYGRNTTGGALSIYSTQPTDELGASISVKGGDHGFFEGTAIANIP